MSETQLEELEVLESIYDGDPAFTKVDNTTFQYRYGDDGAYKSFNIQVNWPPTYPDNLPTVTLDTFYNGHVIPEVRTLVHKCVMEEAEQQLGTPMTFTLFECVRDRLEEFLSLQPESRGAIEAAKSGPSNNDECSAYKKDKKVQLTKAQKRKQFERCGLDGEAPRGHDWVNIIRHLSQTGVQNS